MKQGISKGKKIFEQIKQFLKYRKSPLLTPENGMDFVTIVSGSFDPSKLTLFSIFKDEIYFCQAFVDHYRSIGVEQFLILDDGSEDVTFELLRDQKDCVLLKSTLKFGQIIKYRAFGKRFWYSHERAGKALKCVIPHMFLEGSFGLYVDADEFLLLPPEVDSLQTVIERVSSDGKLAIVAPMVVFFPKRFAVIEQEPKPSSSVTQLLDENPYFEATATHDLRSDGTIKRLHRSKSGELFEKFGVSRSTSQDTLEKNSNRLGSGYKVPLLFHSSQSYRMGSHKVNVPVSPDIMLTLAHMVYTENLVHKIERATKWKAHSNGASKYFMLKELILKAAQNNNTLLGPNSRKFRSTSDLMDAGLMRWPNS